MGVASSEPRSRMFRYARWVLVTVGVLVPACGSKSNPSCNESQVCVYTTQGAEVCRQGCFSDAGPSCPSGQICTSASICCGDGTPAATCRSPLIVVCCPVSGC